MIRQLQLTNFRRHTDRHIDFTQGLQVVRGANEMGKSTLAEGICYALFGSRALRTSIDEAVTWGQPTTSLKVTLQLGDHVFSRSPKGAEVLLNGKVFVTGQTEVTNFASQLLGVDAAAATRLMLANQGNLRGALEQGPKAAAMMIEDLGNFDLFETLLERMQAKLLLGSPNALLASLERAKAQLAEYQMPAKPDAKRVKSQIDVHQVKVTYFTQYGPVLLAAKVDADAKLDLIRGAAQTQKRLQQQLKAAQDNKAYHEESRQKALTQAAQLPDETRITALRDMLANIEKEEATRKAWDQFNRYTEPAQVWAGDRDSFQTHLVDLRCKAENLRTITEKCNSDVRVLAAQKITGSLCGYCGKDFSEVPEVAQKNAELDAQIQSRQQQIQEAQAALGPLNAEVAQLEALLKDEVRTNNAAHQLQGYVNLDHGVFPPRLVWAGPTVSSQPTDADNLRVELNTLEEQKNACIRAGARAEAMNQTLAEDQARIEALLSEIESTPKPSEAEIEAHLSDSNSAHGKYNDAEMGSKLAQVHINNLTQELQTAQATYDAAAATQERLKETVTQGEADIESLHFNNTLLKKIRVARPLVADKLWNAVLAAVSTMFSTMRGEKSVVSKSGEGFLVNGQQVASLSGSTLDLLGLAIRCALIKTFLPACPFMLLDEPGAAMDDNRVASLLAFLTANGIQQTILVTHDSIAESVADNLIEI